MRAERLARAALREHAADVALEAVVRNHAALNEVVTLDTLNYLDLETTTLKNATELWIGICTVDSMNSPL